MTKDVATTATPSIDQIFWTQNKNLWFLRYLGKKSELFKGSTNFQDKYVTTKRTKARTFLIYWIFFSTKQLRKPKNMNFLCHVKQSTLWKNGSLNDFTVFFVYSGSISYEKWHWDICASLFFIWRPHSGPVWIVLSGSSIKLSVWMVPLRQKLKDHEFSMYFSENVPLGLLVG